MVVRSGFRALVPCEPGDLGKREAIFPLLQARLQTQVKSGAWLRVWQGAYASRKRGWGRRGSGANAWVVRDAGRYGQTHRRDDDRLLARM